MKDEIKDIIFSGIRYALEPVAGGTCCTFVKEEILYPLSLRDKTKVKIVACVREGETEAILMVGRSDKSFMVLYVFDHSSTKHTHEFKIFHRGGEMELIKSTAVDITEWIKKTVTEEKEVIERYSGASLCREFMVYSGQCPDDVLRVKMPDNIAAAGTVGDYLRMMLVHLIHSKEGFSGKRPFGTGHEFDDIYLALAAGGVIPSDYDKSYRSFADTLLVDAICDLFESHKNPKPKSNPNEQPPQPNSDSPIDLRKW
ncbi:MAG: hypothetical protein HC888_00730 [Candidatus Competibacteraceae bacterium]|nr:hypothetical protein [Candidatus Competibacteraceae bacterium]